ncbi:MAG: PEP-CTERM sorting domain-containing protein [Planctomycetaceae bacterium]|nr:PEP-CTERM sorting domain-containing protein [Planctomycetaceae bacterium]
MRALSLALSLALALAASTATATTGTLNWAYQPTGFQAGSGSSPVQTGLAMRDGIWPTIFATDPSNSVQAYSLYPVANTNQKTQYPTYWHQVGYNLLANQSSSTTILSAATSPDGRFGAVLTSVYSGGCVDSSQAIVGSSASGFGSVMNGIRAITFSANGSLVTGSMSTIPPINGVYPKGVVSIAVSPQGDTGALDANGYYYQQSSLMGGWASAKPGLDDRYTAFASLAMDKLGRPYIVGPASTGLAAFNFDIPTGQWKQQILSSTIQVGGIPTIAADSKGGIGIAWVQENLGSQTWTLEYAYQGGDNNWIVRDVTSSVYNQYTSNWESLCPCQRVGLAFDDDNLPVISFATGSSSSGNLWLAYDPVSTPEPSTLALLAVGVAAAMYAKSRRRRHA